MADEKIINGIDVQQLNQSRNDLIHQPELARFKFRAHNRWVNGAHAETKIKDFYGLEKECSHSQEFTLHADEPAELAGTDTGPNATEACLYALASCLNATFMYQAAAKGIKIDELELELEGDIDLRGFMAIDDAIKKGFQQIRIICKVKSEAPEYKLNQVLDFAKKHSPVFDIVTGQTPVEVTIQKTQPAEVGAWTME